MNEPESQPPINGKAQPYFGHARREMLPFIPVGATCMLDVGCASGRFGGMVREERPGVEVWGVEPVPEVAELARKILSQVVCSPIESAIGQLPDTRFDCVTFNDVLEHLEDPWEILRLIRPKLSVGGIVIASIPNLRHYPVIRSLLVNAEFTYAPDGVLDRTHLRFFTKKSMQRMMVDSGYEILTMQGLCWQSFPPWLGVLNRIVGRALDDMHYLQFAIVARPRR